MINHRGVNMKRLIALLAVVALSITILSPPVAAVCPDPHKQLPWMDPSARPNGDGDPWDVEKVQAPRFAVFSYRGLFFPTNWIVFVFNKLDVTRFSLDDNDKNIQPPGNGSEGTPRSGQL
jgi:hypothetical protein